jgi:TPR repeat protein
MKLAFKHTIAATLMMLSLAAPVAAGPLEDGSAAYDRGDFATALRLFHLLADQGNALAQFNLGFMYSNGRGVTQNDAEAVKWYRLAADQNDAIAQSNLGDMYSYGRSVPKDYVRAQMWFILSAEHGNQTAAEKREINAQHMTPEQVADAQKLAREWKPTKQPPR